MSVVIVTPPFSPHDACPPLGPAVLAAHLQLAGVNCRTIDLNIRFLNRFASPAVASIGPLGDHGKGRARVSLARERFRASLHLPPSGPHLVPPQADPKLALAHTFTHVERALRHMLDDPMWTQLFEDHVQPALAGADVLGLSIMGPSQVLAALALAHHARRVHPRLVIVAGGSHITLLADAIAADPRYGHGVVDGFLAGHCESDLVELVRRVARQLPWHQLPTVVVPGSRHAPTMPRARAGWLPPVFDVDELALYDRHRLAIPMQLQRGCGYGRCRFCTYPSVEPELIGLGELAAAAHVKSVVDLGVGRLSVKDSLMDLKAMARFGRLLAIHTPALTWSATTRISCGLKPDFMGELYRKGCRTLEYGVETVHPRLQDLIQKSQPRQLVESAIQATCGAGIHAVVNLLYGLPGETESEAHEQLAWFLTMRRRHGQLLHGSHNLVEVNRKSPFALQPKRYGITLGAVAPWAFSHVWDAPDWRSDFGIALQTQIARLRLDEEAA